MHPIFSEDHDLIRSQLRRFVDEKVRPEGPKWEEAGFVPRAVKVCIAWNTGM